MRPAGAPRCRWPALGRRGLGRAGEAVDQLGDERTQALTVQRAGERGLGWSVEGDDLLAAGDPAGDEGADGADTVAVPGSGLLDGCVLDGGPLGPRETIGEQRNNSVGVGVGLPAAFEVVGLHRCLLPGRRSGGSPLADESVVEIRRDAASDGEKHGVERVHGQVARRLLQQRFSLVGVQRAGSS